MLFAAQVSFAQWAINATGNHVYNTNTGNVGIGTSTPTTGALVVYNPGAFTNGLGVNIQTAGDENSTFQVQNAGVQWQFSARKTVQGNSFFFTNYYGGTWYSPLIMAPGSSGKIGLGGNITNATTLAGAIMVLNAGNVGIGTASPSSKLQVVGDIASVYGTNRLRFEANANGNYYIGHNSTNLLNFQTNSADRLTIDGNGNVGIGTTNPNVRLHVKNGGISSSDQSFDNINVKIDGTAVPALRFTRWTGAGTNQHNAFVAQFFNTALNEYSLGIGVGSSTSGDQTYANTAITTTLSGNVGIGTTDPKGYKLAVNGDAIFTKVKVKTYSTWPDYVFHPTYKLPSLQEVEAFIREHKHLPDVPSARQVEKDGLDIGANQAVLLKKIEELTLYVIEIKKETESQKKEIAELKQQLGHRQDK